MTLNKVLTLAFVRKEGEILLGFKKRGFGAGRWNGFGGKVEAGETVAQGAKRELLEESGIEAKTLNRIGLLMFEFTGEPQLLEVHVFHTEEFSGTPAETEEMLPRWYRLSDIPFSAMWPDDLLWFPLLLSGKPFYGYFVFRGMDTIIRHSLSHVDSLESISIPQRPQMTHSD